MFVKQVETNYYHLHHNAGAVGAEMRGCFGALLGP
jgi:hypothetical protein